MFKVFELKVDNDIWARELRIGPRWVLYHYCFSRLPWSRDYNFSHSDDCWTYRLIIYSDGNRGTMRNEFSTRVQRFAAMQQEVDSLMT